jgi:hypothetical protein
MEILMTADVLLNDFAIRSFRDIADADYIVARMACRAGLVSQYLWASQQSIEKYLKCILLLNRIPARQVKHDLGAALCKINSSGMLALDLTVPTKKFIDYLDSFGRFRYLEISNYAFSSDIVRLDRTVWELRRYSTLSCLPRTIKVQEGVSPPKLRLLGGYLEKIIDNLKSPAREPLLWQNAFFGKRTRKRVRVRGGFHATNSPLYLHPEILDEVVKYVYLPKDVEDAYRAHAQTMSPGVAP